MQLYILEPDYGASTLPWHWLQDPRPWSVDRDTDMIRDGRKADTWQPFTVEVVRSLPRDDPHYCRMKRGDFYYLATGYPVVNQRAWSILEPVIGPHAEALPLETDIGLQLFLVNILDRVPLAKDAKVAWNSVIKWFTFVHRYSFREKDVAGKVIFRVEGLGRGDCFVADAVREAVVAAKLRGVRFREITDWQSEVRSVYRRGRNRRSRRGSGETNP